MTANSAGAHQAVADYTAGLPTKRMAAAVLFFDDTDRLLLVEPAYHKDHWELPGGCVEADESPRAAAVREIHEELGLTVEPGRLLAIDWVPPRSGRTEGLMLVFDGGMLSPEQVAAIQLPPDELRSWAWSTPSEQEQRLSPLLARRAAASCRARAEGLTAYLENGCPTA
ncbi:NUDIX hydrolase [Actinoplanes sp. DH11]|uniref:NUDIX domain-containing protein n=1 Tax=Actinoplanes sp. DH11 TaxID=2857011 RepID=UPI001E5E1B43|nr:NUDIX hydrolase [Actinoplanes sp. DH11]